MAIATALRTVRMAVLSDPHASSRGAERSWVSEAESSATANPLAGVVELIEDTPELEADVLLCPGDLCDQADWTSLPYAWRELESIAAALGAGSVIATAGNHDIDSRNMHNPAAVEHGLRALAPEFPTGDPGQATHYWAERVTLVRGPDWQVVSLNSSLMRHLLADEEDHGHVDDATLELIRQAVRGASFPVNALLCHHHPQPFTRLDPTDRSHMAGGDRLVMLLNDLPDNWMIVHGHKHEPHLDYLEGTGASPTRLASASVGANLWPTLAAHVRNQLHLIEFPLADCQRLNLTLGGRVRSWTWQPVTGWRRSLPQGDGLPASAGFGYRRDGTAIANELIQRAQANGLALIERPTLLAWDESIEFLLPADQRSLRSRLQHHHGCHIALTDQGQIDRIVLPAP